ncbi:putative Deoxyuridine 5'-triphosphate nucleotidohydrolase [Seiridium cardinale]|uniref:Deoxyuridine 5'-triphosphate nucleotidohydrolase n=1 Tax=Seiridium cardinale TaxID=138064 RepID=A0ABR2XJ67_9PEZI
MYKTPRLSAVFFFPTTKLHQNPLNASPSRLHRHLPHHHQLAAKYQHHNFLVIHHTFPPHRAMSTVPSVASPPTSPPAKRHKPSNSIAEAAHTSVMATENSNGTAVPLIEQSPPLLIKKLSDKAKVPTRGSAFAAGYDLYAAKETVIPKRGKALVDTDIAIAVPAGTCKLMTLLSPAIVPFPFSSWLIITRWCATDGRIAPRSGLASKHFIDTGAGVIDADYRGQVKVLLFNHNDADFEVKEGDRVAQLVIERIYTPEVVEVAELEESVRGAGGFGSTGKN